MCSRYTLQEGLQHQVQKQKESLLLTSFMWVTGVGSPPSSSFTTVQSSRPCTPKAAHILNCFNLCQRYPRWEGLLFYELNFLAAHAAVPHSMTSVEWIWRYPPFPSLVCVWLNYHLTVCSVMGLHFLPPVSFISFFLKCQSWLTWMRSQNGCVAFDSYE